MFTGGEPKFISHFHWCYAPKRLEVGDFFRISLKTLDYFLSLKKSGKLVFGGMRAGVKSAVLIFDVESHNELDKLLFSIPLFNYFSESEIYPLNSIEERQVIVEDLKKASMK